jgi:single-stranded DNA-binding protein
MQAAMNRCTLLGVVSRHGVEVSYSGQGTARASFMLVVSEQGNDGREHQLWQPVEIWGKKAEPLGELDPGAWVLVEGKLRRVKKGEGWETVVSGFEAQPLRMAPATVGQD